MINKILKNKNEYALPLLILGVIEYSLSFWYINNYYAHPIPPGASIPGYQTAKIFFQDFYYYSLLTFGVGFVQISAFLLQTKASTKIGFRILILGTILCLPLYIFSVILLFVYAILSGLH